MWTITARGLSDLLLIARRLQENEAWSGAQCRSEIEFEIDRVSYREQLRVLAESIEANFPELSPLIRTIQRSRPSKSLDWQAVQITRINGVHKALMQKFVEGEKRELFAPEPESRCPKCQGSRSALNEGRLCSQCLSWDEKMASIWIALKRAAVEKIEWTDETGLSTRKVADEWRTLRRLADEVFERKHSERELFDAIRESMMHGEELNTFLDTSIKDVETFLHSRLCELSTPYKMAWSVDEEQNQTRSDDNNSEPSAPPQKNQPGVGTQQSLKMLGPILKQIYDILDGKAMRVEELAQATTGGDTSRLYKLGLKSVLFNQKLVDYDRAVGYFRQDSPPKDLQVPLP